MSNFSRRKTTTVHVGSICIGSDCPIVIQSMANTDTNDIEGSVSQAKRLFDAGAQMVRFTTQGKREVESLRQIRERLNADGYTLPLVADVHFNSDVADLAATVVEKVRINPGNYAKEDVMRTKFLHLLDICREHKTALRIGVNHGSLSQRMLDRYGDTPEGMVASCMEFLRICKEQDFQDVVISVKASITRVMVATVRLMVEAMEREDMYFPLHLGVTEAGEGEDGRLKSAIGIGSLLVDGIGDTIRVSLSEDPVNEIPVAKDILQAAGVIRYKTEYISCPSCGRTLFDIEKTIAKVKEVTKDLKGGLKIAVMGCVVNGPGEMADADYGYVGAARGKVSLYKGKECILKNLPQEEAAEKLLQLIYTDHPELK